MKIKPVESRDELRMATELMVQVHVDGDLAARRWLEDCSWQYPGYRQEHTRIATHKGEMLGALRLPRDPGGMGDAGLTWGGLGWLATAPRHRRKGVCRRIIEDTIRYMRANGYHVSMLFGIPNFYHRFGYVSTLADYSVIVDTFEALTFENPFRASLATPAEVGVIQRIHNANDANSACSLVRTVAHVHNKWGRWGEWILLKDDQGKPVAYLVEQEDGDCLNVIEAGVGEMRVCAAVVRHAGDIAESKGMTRIRFCVPPPSPIARFLSHFRSVHETRIDRDAGGMMAFINPGEALESMIPEWESQLSRSAARELRTEFTLVVNGAVYRIRANRGAVDVSATPGASKIGLKYGDLMHLVTGYRYPNDVLDERRCLVTGDARILFSTLFPKRHPFVWRFDRF